MNARIDWRTSKEPRKVRLVTQHLADAVTAQSEKYGDFRTANRILTPAVINKPTAAACSLAPWCRVSHLRGSSQMPLLLPPHPHPHPPYG